MIISLFPNKENFHIWSIFSGLFKNKYLYASSDNITKCRTGTLLVGFGLIQAALNSLIVNMITRMIFFITIIAQVPPVTFVVTLKK